MMKTMGTLGPRSNSKKNEVKGTEEGSNHSHRYHNSHRNDDNFSGDNKLGKGGFGHVYKGMLKEGKKIAVKRLSKDSAQGLDEFKNEVTLIVKLQHHNLVKLFSCCIKGDERMLIYEYLPNGDGIARGLLYLHHDSKLRVIHRDLKAITGQSYESEDFRLWLG
ncbi:hypothetical protein REPUB_Repub13aG0064300 [Reevesia pubescens]